MGIIRFAINNPVKVAVGVILLMLFGVLSVSSRSKKTNYDQEDLEALQVFAETAGICCRHFEQTTWMRQTIQRMDRELTDRDEQRKTA